ncbi:YjjI family glycine radical enzyme [Peptoniphilus sp. oral taxon 386]|uniref:YjjI family glycine radical enzyme n=1 Tax=Peptoniphilus sp. oral taxon 386 TaxID=652713 RepID=UPI0001DA9AB4|nr:YjjI family glycine radical enzyme [Peptoniphilus sp. oral taxon 386]EFI41998.1 glycine radical enzyme, YjjI family [Peptoniphilus sp. oral taxon 386 str. F0131]
MERFFTVEQIKNEVLNTMQNPALTYEQQTSRLAKISENIMDYPVNENDDFYNLYELGEICDLDEGHAPYAPRYILPDYEKLLKEGCEFLRLTPAKNLREAINNLLIFYHHVPSVTRFPVYIGSLDKLLEPFIEDEKDADEIIRLFLIQLDRTIDDSFCHANIGPEETKAGNIILNNLASLQNVTPNLTLLYDKDLTPDSFAEKAIEVSIDSANPAFANLNYYQKDFGKNKFGIASCYNALPVCGGAFTLSRLRLNKIALAAKSYDDFFENTMPHAIDTMLHFMESKIDFLVNKTQFFETNFLVKEGFVKKENFVGLFGVVGLYECVNELAKKLNEDIEFGHSDKADEIGLRVMDELEKRVKSFKSKYSNIWNHEFMLHSQVGAANDEGTTAGVRIKIGREPMMYEHITQAAKFHKYFPSGVGDHFPFENTAKKNPKAVLDIFKAAFEMGMRYISSYGSDSDLIRVTGYLVKKSDIEKINRCEQVSYDTVQYAQDAFNKYELLNRKVRNV